MKKNSRTSTARVLAGLPFFLVSIFLIVVTVSDLSADASAGKTSANGSGTVSPAAAVPATFSGTYDPTEFPCGTPLNGPFTAAPTDVRIVVTATATIPTNDLTVTLLYGATPGTATPVAGPEDAATSSEVLLYQPGGPVPSTFPYWVQVCETPSPGAVPQVAPFDYNGTFTSDSTGPAGGVPPPKTTNAPAAPLDTGAKVGFENFSAPGVLVQVKTTEAGQQPNGVEYMGRNAGEPSIGNNWLTDTSIYYSGLETLFVKFDGSCPASGLSSTWVNRAAPTQIAVDSDPIGFTDSPLGRSFTGELTLLSPTCKTSFTDNDGQIWVPTQGSGLASAVDHETIGGGVYHTPIPSLPTPYNHAVYYCSQDTQNNTGLCSRSDDGGLTFGPSVPVTPPLQNVCTGLHGHVKVSPKDGTVYVPFNTCDGAGSVAESEDNGITWTVRHVQNGVVSTAPSASFQDPAVSIDANGRVYFAIANNDTQAVVATSDDHGQTWKNLFSVSDVYGLKNVRYPAATAGDMNRAAVAFYGTTTAGDALQPTFAGVWHLYVASTFDGGKHWTTTDATPNAPMQRGCIWAKGGANICRNLLDFFDMTVDKNGRVQVGYVNGCEGGPCVQAPLTAQGESLPGQGNGYTSTATIARQSSGRRLFAANDPATTSKPGMPLLTARRVGNVVHLQWSEADTGNLTITNYRIRRGTSSNAETLLTIAPGSQTGGTYDDTLASNDTTAYYYEVVAVNSAGNSCPNNEVFVPYVGDTCSGLVIHRNDPAHQEANTQTATPPSLLIDYVAVAEPPATDLLMFKMKVNSLAGSLPPNSRWRIVWNSYSAQAVAGDVAAQQWFTGMTTDSNGVPSFTYGTLADAGVPAVFVISEQQQFPADPASNYQPDGTITLFVPKSGVGNPQPGALLGGVNGRTFADNSVQERSNTYVDHTFVKAQTDNSYPASTYLVSGNNFCSSTGIAPIGAVSRKTHGSVGDFDIDLPLSGPEGIEDRTSTGNYRIVVTFPGPIASIGSASCGGQAATKTINGSVVTVNCTGVPNAQNIVITLNNVSDGTNVGNVSIPMGVLAGDTNADRVCDANDVNQTKSQSGKPVTGSNFREDVNHDGLIDANDVSLVKSKSGTSLPPQ
jgi:hypothetical protein